MQLWSARTPDFLRAGAAPLAASVRGPTAPPPPGGVEVDRRTASTFVAGVLAVLTLSAGCAVKEAIDDPRRPGVTVGPAPAPTRRSLSPGPAAESARPYRLSPRAPNADPRLATTPVSLSLDRVPLGEALVHLADSLGFELLVDQGLVGDLELSLRVSQLPLGELLTRLGQLFPIEFELEGRLLVVHPRPGARLALLVYPLPGGLIQASLPNDFDSLRQLSFISRVQRQESEGDGGAALVPAEGPSAVEPVSHLEKFLARMPELVPWPDGSTWFLDRRHNLLFVRSEASSLDQIERCLDTLARSPDLIEIEARFLELSAEAARELGVEFGLTEFAQLGDDREMVSLSPATGQRVGIAPLIPGAATGLNLEVLGILSEPRFEALLRALESEDEAEVLSAPTIASVNNSRATIAITTNLPYVEDYRPVFDTTVVSRDGLSTSDANVALVAVVNDRNFTGIVLNVTPSAGARPNEVQLRIQPVIRDQVDTITIPSGAVVQGVEAPAITRPVIETRYLDTQLVVTEGATVVLGGLRSNVMRTRVVGIPWLMRAPLIGFLFRRETRVREQRDLLIFVTARRVEVGR
ncbi:MAG: type II secretion system protein GspD [Planctomycetota bacterium]